MSSNPLPYPPHKTDQIQKWSAKLVARSVYVRSCSFFVLRSTPRRKLPAAPRRRTGNCECTRLARQVQQEFSLIRESCGGFPCGVSDGTRGCWFVREKSQLLADRVKLIHWPVGVLRILQMLRFS